MTTPAKGSLRICWNNYAQPNALIVGQGSSSVVSLPKSNMLDDDIHRIWRSASPASEEWLFTADLSAVRPIGIVALINANGFSPATYSIRISTDDTTGGNGNAHIADDLPGIPSARYNKFVHLIEPAASGRYVKVNEVDVVDQPEVGRLVIGDVWVPSRHMSFGREFLTRDPSIRAYSIARNVFTDVKPRQRGWRFRLHGVTTEEVQEQVEPMNLLVGVGLDIFVCWNADSDNLARDSVWGMMEEPARSTQPNPDFWTVEFEVWERT